MSMFVLFYFILVLTGENSFKEVDYKLQITIYNNIVVLYYIYFIIMY